MSAENPITVEDAVMTDDEGFLSAEDESHVALDPKGASMAELEVPKIPTSAIQEKLRALAAYSTSSLVTEVKRLASLSYHALQREFELREHIHKLPLEILGEIFVLGQQLELEAQRPPLYGDIDYVPDDDDKDIILMSHLIAAQVCTRWRNVVLNTGMLWRRISIVDKDPWTWSQLCLARSGETPLRINIPWTNDEDESDSSGADDPETQKRKQRHSQEALEKVLAFLLPAASRWESFTLCVDTYEVMFGVLVKLLSIQAPMLTELELSNHDDVAVGDTFEPASLNGVIPILQRQPIEDIEDNPQYLKRAKFWGVHVDWTSSLYRSLTSLTLAYHSVDVRPKAETFFGILENSKETLVHLVLECSGPQQEDEKGHGWPEEPIFLPQLRTLKVAFLPPAYVQDLIVTFEVPSLDRLHFDLGDEDGDVEDWNRVIEVLCTGTYIPDSGTRTTTRRGKSSLPLFPSITSLKLSAFPADPTHLGILLYSLPLIKEFIINFHYLPQEFLYFLTISTAEILKADDLVLPRWVPQSLKQYVEDVKKDDWVGKIEYLLPELKVFRAYNLESHALRYLVEFRLKVGLGLKEVHYSDGSSIYRQDRIWLKKNLERFSEFEDTDDEDEEEDEEEEEEDDEEGDDLINGDDEDDEDDDQQAPPDAGGDDDEWEDEEQIVL